MASQVASVTFYLVQAGHVIWDLQSEDVLLSYDTQFVHLTLLDVFMPPCACLGRATSEVVAHAPYLDYLDLSSLRNSGCIYISFPPELKQGGPVCVQLGAARLQLYGDAHSQRHGLSNRFPCFVCGTAFSSEMFRRDVRNHVSGYEWHCVGLDLRLG